MNIVYIGAFRLPNYDAAASRVVNIAKALKAGNHAISFISWGGKYDNKHLIENQGYALENMPYIITDEIDNTNFFKKVYYKVCPGNKTMEILRGLSVQPDVIITYNTPYSFNKKIIKYCKQNNIKLIADITEWYDDNELKRFDRRSNNLNMTKLYKNVPNIIPISSYLSEYYSNANSLVIPATCDKEDSKWNTNKLRVSEFDGVTLIYAGNPARKDDIHTVIRVVNNLCQSGFKLRFLVLGITRNDYLERYSDLLSDIVLVDNIEFLGRVSQQEVPQYYKSADFMVLVRDNTRKSNAGFPTKFAESMIAGVPVIANKTSDIAKYLKTGYNGYLLEGNSYNHVESALRTICLNYDRSKIISLKDGAKETGVLHFDYRAYVLQLNDFMSHLRDL